MFQEARYSQSAYQAVKHYKSLSDAPPEVRDAMAWAIERDSNEQQ